MAHFSWKVFGIDMNMLSYVTVYVWNQKWECKLWVYVVLIVHISTFYLLHFSSMIIRDLTLRSAASFGSFHLIRLLYDEYIFYLVEHRVAAATQQTPIAVMGEVRVLHETNITFIRLLNTVLHCNGERVYILELSKHCWCWSRRKQLRCNPKYTFLNKTYLMIEFHCSPRPDTGNFWAIWNI